MVCHTLNFKFKKNNWFFIDIATSALCCIRKTSATKLECVWPSTSLSVIPDFISQNINSKLENEHECSFLTINPNEKQTTNSIFYE